MKAACFQLLRKFLVEKNSFCPKKFFEKMLETLQKIGAEFVSNFGLGGLFALAFTESFFQPIPVDPILLFVGEFSFSPFAGFCVALTGSVLGGAVGWLLGKALGRSLAVKLFGERKMLHAEKFLQKWEFAGVVLVAFTPIPFKIAAWCAGIFRMRLGQFVVAATIGRAARFALVTFMPQLFLPA